jgi:hypothetical protein
MEDLSLDGRWTDANGNFSLELLRARPIWKIPHGENEAIDGQADARRDVYWSAVMDCRRIWRETPTAQ